MKFSDGIWIGILIGVIIGYLIFGLTSNMWKDSAMECIDDKKEMMIQYNNAISIIQNCEMREDAYIMDLEDAYDIDLYGGGGAR